MSKAVNKRGEGRTCKKVSKEVFFITKYGVVLKITVAANKGLTVALHTCKAIREIMALRLAKIQRVLAEAILSRYNGDHPCVRLLVLFDDTRWKVCQTP
jgi:hypothetical protein